MSKSINELLSERLREIGAKGGRQSAKNLTKQERSEKARKAAATRWAKKRQDRLV